MDESVPKGPTEPSSDIRQACSAMWQMYVGLTSEGFNEAQALKIIGQILQGKQGDKD